MGLDSNAEEPETEPETDEAGGNEDVYDYDSESDATDDDSYEFEADQGPRETYPMSHVLLRLARSSDKSDTGFSSSEFSVTPITLDARIVIRERLALEFILPLSYASWKFENSGGGLIGEPPSGEASTLRLGNPTAAVMRAFVHKGLFLAFGGGLSLPLAKLPDDYSTDEEFATLQASAVAYGEAAAIHGLMNLWRYTPSSIALFAPFTLTSRHKLLDVGGDVAMALLFSTDDEVEQDTLFLFQTATHVGVRSPVLAAGLNLQSVVSSEEFGPDESVQNSMLLYGEITPKPLVIGLGYFLPLGGPIGDLERKGVHFWGGGRF
jgi:hypothetical protein